MLSTSLAGWLLQAGLITSAILLPALCHLSGLPVRSLLPMHWPVLVAGILLGWRGGLLVGGLSPAANWLITGFPLPPVLPAMTIELAAYGFVTGWLYERLGWNGFASVAAGIIAGRAIFVITVLLTGGYSGHFGQYLIAAMTPGIFAAVVQVGAIGVMGKFHPNPKL